MLTFDPITLSPSEFEEAVKAILDVAGVPLKDYKSQHLASLTRSRFTCGRRSRRWFLP